MQLIVTKQCFNLCELVQAEEPALVRWEQLGVRRGLPSGQAPVKSFFSLSPFVGSCFKMLGFVLTGSEKTLVAPHTLNFKKFNSYGGRIDR